MVCWSASTNPKLELKVLIVLTARSKKIYFEAFKIDPYEIHAWRIIIFNGLISGRN